MNQFDPIIDESYRRYADLLIQHSNLIVGHQEETEEMEAVEGELERLWETLGAIQRQSLAKPSSDLGWVRRRFEPAPRGRHPDEVTGQDIRLLIDAKDRSDWHGVLHHLRICSAIVSAFQLAYLRASAWSALDHLRQASFFYDVASGIDPSNGSVALLALETVAQFDREAAIERAQVIGANPFRHPTLLIVFSLALLPKEGGGPAGDRVLDLLRRCLDR